MKTNTQDHYHVDTATVDINWQHARASIFWGEIAPCDHVVQIYEDDNVFMDTLAGFVGGGINMGDSCIVIATDAHLKALETRLTDLGIHLEALISGDRYIPLNAEETLAKFMVDDWPDEKLFAKTITELIKRAGYRKHRIRAFGEMVALLWAQGRNGATVQLEHLWNKFCDQNSFSLFCAYPKSGFTHDINNSLRNICTAHAKMISGSHRQLTEVIFRDIVETE